MLWCQGAQNMDYPTMIHANVHRMITMHARPRLTDRRMSIMAIARQFLLTNASRAKNYISEIDVTWYEPGI